MEIRDSVAFVTGANRGIGLVFAHELLAAGARRVYAAARNPERISLDGVTRIPLDVTNPSAVASAAIEYPDVRIGGPHALRRPAIGYDAISAPMSPTARRRQSRASRTLCTQLQVRPTKQLVLQSIKRKAQRFHSLCPRGLTYLKEELKT